MAYINRGRDVMMLMQKKGEQGIKEAIIKIAEDNTILHQEITELRRVTEHCIKLLGTYGEVMGGMQQGLERMARKYNPDNEANPDQKWS